MVAAIKISDEIKLSDN